jgi:hypothetical protein
MKAFVASTLLKKLIGPDADLFFDSNLCLASLIMVSLIMVPLIMDPLLSLRDSAALCFPQIARGTDGGDR